MRTFSKPLLRAALSGLLAFSIPLPCAQAKDKAKDKPVHTEPTVKLDPFEVKTNPFAWWGIGIVAPMTGLNKLFGGPPEAMYVYSVDKGSPADLVGVQLGDEIAAVDGCETNSLRWKALVEHFYHTEKGEVVTLTLFDCIQGKSRTVKLEIGSNKSWMRKDAGVDWVCWGLLVLYSAPVPPKPVHFDFHVWPKEQRIKEYWTVPVTQRRKTKTKQGVKYITEPVLTEDGKPKTEKKPLYIDRRAVTITWAEAKLTLIERENRIVEVIEGGKVPEKDDVVGRLMQEGSTLTLRADGTYELKDAPSKTEPAQTLSVSPPVLPAAPAAAPQAVAPSVAS